MKSILERAAKALAGPLLVALAGPAMAQGNCGPETLLSPIPQYAIKFRICDSTLFGTVTTLGTGWAAVGFGRDQFMPETDVFMAGVSGGVAYSQDAFAVLRNPPVRDISQDVTLLSATEINGVTSFSFSRLLNTGDAAGDFDLTNGAYYILMAYEETSDSLTSRHSWADASDQAYFFSPVPEPAAVLMMLAGLGLVAQRARAGQAHRTDSAAR
ncbi:hypothetical protein D621_07175 [beta proteobacterium AAP51]|nr:hypothetical protein D621_07175 [beta proteobacterium AAP51]